MMEELRGTSTLYGGNAPFIEAQYETYLNDPNSVSAEWRSYFDRLRDGASDIAHGPIIDSFIQLAKDRKATNRVVDETFGEKQVRVALLMLRFRVVGVRQADLDPLERTEKPFLPELDPASCGFTDPDMDRVFQTGTTVGPPNATLREVVAWMRETYCGKIGVEYYHITDTPQRVWLQERFESCRSTPSYDAEMKKHILERVTAAETLEKYLHTRYVGQKRFSGEGGETMIAMLDRLLQQAGAVGVQETVIGMAHRARLNVLVNTLGKMPKDLFSEFEGKYADDLSAGDVKYHKGFSSDVITPGGPMHLTLAFNPSHLEIVNPVVEGSVRARQHRRKDELGAQVMPVVIHGDAAIAGQGVVMETMNFAQTRGYRTGGTVHIIINNQIGFTTSDPRDTRGTIYCSDVAKMIEAPIFHVNADDPERALLVTDIALEYRTKYHKDVVIDLVCYRRLGHNEQDEPMVTQPLMYKKIAAHPSTRQIYAERLIREGVIKDGEDENLIASFREAMDKGLHTNKTILSNFKPPFAVDWSPYQGSKWTEPVDTGVSMKTLQSLSKRLTEVPLNFKLHSRVDKIIADRKAMGKGALPLDWGMAENLAYASLLNDNYGIRLSGQDSGRGTFFHRHAVLHDQNREKWNDGTYVPLEHIKKGQPDFMVIDSVLSEEAVLGFEYGYSSSEPNQLVIWEAQFGDFANGAQVVIDQFISSGEVKWGRVCGLTLFLPHGYEGQGPEHSSARPERFLQLCAEHNMQVVVPSVPAQMFHVLRRQIMRPFRKPLIVFTPKSLLRHKESVSSLQDLADGQFRTVFAEQEKLDGPSVKRIIIASGKVYFDLLAYRREKKITDVAVVRLEQQYPFPHADFRAAISPFTKARIVVWCQEEPQNQGAWYRIREYLRKGISEKQILAYAGRPVSASPAVGYATKHLMQQKQLVEDAFTENSGLEETTDVE